MASHGADDRYHRVDAVKAGVTGAAITGAAGLFAASIKNAMRVENVGSMGVFTKSGGFILTFSTNFPGSCLQRTLTNGFPLCVI